MPEEEFKVFKGAKDKLPCSSLVLTLPKNDLLLLVDEYLNNHNLAHSELNDRINNVGELEVLTTLKGLRSFDSRITTAFEAYLHLALSVLKETDAEYFLSEKILVGYFIERGGLEPSLWGRKVNRDVVVEVLNNLEEKVNQNKVQSLLDRYKNFKIKDYLLE